ncbi:hypothetical protein D3C79_753360 [compost metagenome]
MRVEHQVIAGVGQVQVIVQQAAIPIGSLAHARNIAHTFHDHGDRPGSQQGMAQIGDVQVQAARREVGQWLQRRSTAGIMKNDPLEVTGQARAADQVVGDHRRQAHAQASAMIVSKQSTALHHHDVQAIVSTFEDLRVASFEQFIEHALAAAADFGLSHALGKVLFGVKLSQSLQGLGRVGQAGTGEAPGTDRGADQ